MLQIPEVLSPVNTSDAAALADWRRKMRSRTAQVSADHPVRVVTGRKLNRLIKKASARDRSLIAVDIAQGVMQIRELTYGQAAALARVSTSYVATVGALTPEDRVQLARGRLSLPLLHNRRRSVDAEIDRLIAKFGDGVILAALDRMTAPPTNGNATTNTVVAE